MPACPASLLRQSPPHPPTTTTTLLQGNYSDLLVILSAVYSDLRGDRGPMPQGDDAFAEVRGAAGHIGGGWGGVLTRGLPLACLPSFLGFRAALVLPCSGTICSTTKYSLPPSVLNPFPTLRVSPLQGTIRSTTKYWVRMSDVSTVKHHILQHLPVSQVGRGVGGHCMALKGVLGRHSRHGCM